MDDLQSIRSAVTAISMRLERLEHQRPAKATVVMAAKLHGHDRTQAVVGLRAQGFSKAQIARALNLTEQAVYRALKRTKKVSTL